jgi:hypothetical protein
LADDHRAAEPPDFLTLESSVSDSLLSAVSGSAWAGYDGAPVLPATEVEAALAAALDPKLWAEVRHV